MSHNRTNHVRNTILTIGTALLLSACGTAPHQPISPVGIKLKTTTFDSEAAARLLADGTNTIRGNAFMRQRGGGVVTCAGSDVRLIPATEYAKNRFDVLYGDVKTGSRSPQPLLFDPEFPAYRELVKMTKCDSQGNFKFDRVADGDFFVLTVVAWQAGNSAQGAALMHRLSVKNGEVVELILAA